MFSYEDNGHADRPAPDHAPRCAHGFGLTPWGVVAQGVPPEPTERMIGLQAALYRLIVAVEEARLPRLRGFGPAAPARRGKGAAAR